ncbi:MAG TPA: 2-phospho-L-lactate guanylyltransferase [Mycobacteriales bacterium]|nr:2-phospho-L-lactate guanylyltransferase [Mycobacteriales bacterium]
MKRLELAKTRLAPYGEQERQELALAFAADVVEAALGAAKVLVVTDDERARERLQALGATVTPDDPAAGLNPALAHGADLLRAEQPDCGVATLSADLPALRTDHLRAALAAVGRGRGFVADLEGSGTTLLVAGQGSDLGPAFGAGSRAAHLASGAVELIAARGLRCDVDTPADLLCSLALGAGRHTSAAAAALGLVVRSATVRTWDGDGGSALGDDGSLLALDADALHGSGFRFVRVGQRVRLSIAPDGTTRLALP